MRTADPTTNVAPSAPPFSNVIGGALLGNVAVQETFIHKDRSMLSTPWEALLTVLAPEIFRINQAESVPGRRVHVQTPLLDRLTARNVYAEQILLVRFLSKSRSVGRRTCAFARVAVRQPPECDAIVATAATNSKLSGWRPPAQRHRARPGFKSRPGQRCLQTLCCELNSVRRLRSSRRSKPLD